MFFNKVFVCSMITLSVICQKDKDEGRPYEFGFTIDGQQHRHEKKDQNGIIQGEFGFITADGVYHVTVYATDENGNFKILSMKNIRISAPLDGSPAWGPISPDASKYLKKIPAPKNNNQYEKLQEPSSTQKYSFTTHSTIKPACAGCGLITPAPPGSKFVFQNPSFKNQPEPPVYKTQPKDAETLPEGYPGVKSSGVIQNSTPDSRGSTVKKVTNSDNQNDFYNNVSDKVGSLVSKEASGLNLDRNMDSLVRKNGGTTQGLNIETLESKTGVKQNPAYNNNNLVSKEPSGLNLGHNMDTLVRKNDDKVAVNQGINPETNSGFKTGLNQNSGYNNDNLVPKEVSGLNLDHNMDSLVRKYDDKVAATQGVNPESLNQFSDVKTGVKQNTGYNNNNLVSKEVSGLNLEHNMDSLVGKYDDKVTAVNQGALEPISVITKTDVNKIPGLDRDSLAPKGVSGSTPYETSPPVDTENIKNRLGFTTNLNKDRSGRLLAPEITGSGPNPLLQPQDVPKLPPIEIEDNIIHVKGKKPFNIPIKDKYPGMSEGLPEGVEPKDVTGILYKFKYTVGFHGHYERGLKDGSKIGGYFVNGRDGISRVVTYVADENGYRPKFKFVNLGLDSEDTPKEGSEKKFGLKEFEFVWYPIE